MNPQNLSSLLSQWQGRQGRPIRNRKIHIRTISTSSQNSQIDETQTPNKRKNTPLKRILGDLQILQSISKDAAFIVSNQPLAGSHSTSDTSNSKSVAHVRQILKHSLSSVVMQKDRIATKTEQSTTQPTSQPTTFINLHNMKQMDTKPNPLINAPVMNTPSKPPISERQNQFTVQVIEQSLPQFTLPSTTISKPLYQSKQRLQNAIVKKGFLELPIPYCIISAKNGYYVDVNNKYSEIVGWTREEHVKMHYKEILVTSDYLFASGLHRQFLKGEISSFPLFTEVVKRKPNQCKGVFALSSVSILDREPDGSLNNFIIASINSEMLVEMISNCCTLENWDIESLEPLTDSLTEIAENIRKHKQEKSFESKIFQQFENMNIACIVCKLQLSEMIIIFGNKKLNHFGLQNIVGKNLKMVLDSNSFEKVEKFVNQKLSFVEFVGQFSTAPYVFRIHAFWMREYIVFNLDNVIIVDFN